MRYFKCQNYEHMEDSSLRERFARLLKEEKRLTKQAKRISRLGTVVFFVLWAALFAGCCILWSLRPDPDTVFLVVLYGVIGLVFYIVTFVVTAFLALPAAMPLWSKKSTSLRGIKQALLSSTCANLRDFYGLQEPYVVTKCYDASNKRFKNHDVCLFVAGDELRLTTNLVNGFFQREKDLGCYAFRREELSVSVIHAEKLQMTELRDGDTVFLLAARAERFIGKHFSPQ